MKLNLQSWETTNLLPCRFASTPTKAFRGGGGLLSNGRPACEPRPARQPSSTLDEDGDEPYTPRSVRTAGRNGSGYMGRGNDASALVRNKNIFCHPGQHGKRQRNKDYKGWALAPGCLAIVL